MANPPGKPTTTVAELLDRVALLRALRLASSPHVTLKLKLSDGRTYRAASPIIIGADTVQFATIASRKPITISFGDIVAFELSS